MSSQQYLPEDANLRNLVCQMSTADQNEYNDFMHLRVDAGYVGRIFILYRPNAANPRDGEPDILGQVKIRDWYASAEEGSALVLEDMFTGGIQTIRHVPQRLFDYDVFVSVPPYQRLRYEARPSVEGIQRSLIFSVAIKTMYRSRQYDPKTTFCESPKGFKELYPESTATIKFI